MVNPAGKVVTLPPEPLPARAGSRKLSFVRNQEGRYVGVIDPGWPGHVIIETIN